MVASHSGGGDGSAFAKVTWRMTISGRLSFVSELPSLELLEATHAFPGAYVFKAIGANQDGFAARVVAGVRLELELEIDPPFEVRHTAQGRHVSVTVTPPIESAPQVLAIYTRLRAIEGLVMLF
jgi:uncharacterized protein